MAAADGTTASIGLRYTLTPDDLADGLTALHRSIPLAWYRPLLATLGAAVLTAAVAFALLFGAVPAADAVAEAAVPVVPILAILAIGVLGLVVWRVTNVSGWAHRLWIRRVLRANPTMASPTQATLSDAGIRTSLEGVATTQWSWSQFPVHVETDRSFVLLSARRRGGTVLVLPKRGLAGTAPDRLRGMLAVHCYRADPTAR